VNTLISAGEASGEMYGAQLIEAVRRRCQSLSFFGAGGDRMRAAGCEIVVDAKDLAVVGITEIVSHLPKILGLFKRLIDAADERKPAVAVVIDSPAFNWRVARQMHKRGIPVVYYVCPQFWAWRQGRVKLLRKYVAKALVIFPFEEKFYRDRGVDATFVGHPLADLPMPDVPREQFAIRYGLDPSKTWIALLPGSRRKEFKFNLPPMLEAVGAFGEAFQFVLPVASTLGFQWAHDHVFSTGHMKHLRIKPFIALTRDALPSLRHSRAAIVASGTATVEAALMETPFVMVYRVSPITYALGKPRVKVPYYAMVNLISGQRVVPELVQHDFTAEKVARELKKVISDGPDRETMIRGLKQVREKLKRPDSEGHPADLAAEIILNRVIGPSGHQVI
jgi:lipid-A-disaccharide synthase